MSYPRLRMTCREFMKLPEYSASYPTGTTPGKRWRRLDGAHDPRSRLPKSDPRHFKPRWFVLEYGAVSADGKTIEIKWFHPVLRLPA
jgi:hypothetical protein